ncbi:MAG TPA: hypothetical protein VK841_15445 [Polyangiaceae bacterium]|jgi:hypothetical protein|nr:hypothetical protein [Polyangiaceae bacterium]
MNEYSWPHRAQKPVSRRSCASQFEQKRFRSGTTGGTIAEIGSASGSGGRKSARPVT